MTPREPGESPKRNEERDAKPCNDNKNHPPAASILTPKALPSNTPPSITANPSIPSISASAVLGESTSMPPGTPICRGFDFNSTLNAPSTSRTETEDSLLKGLDISPNNTTTTLQPSPPPPSSLLSSLMSSMSTMGFQATNLSLAIDQINAMRSWRLSHTPINADALNNDPSLSSPTVRNNIRARIFFSYTSNQISSGQREIIRFLVQHKMVDVIVTTAGGIEEDLIKCFEPTFIGDFTLNGKELRKKGLNRIGNLIVPNKNYCQFEDWLSPILNQMQDEQDQVWREWRDRTRTKGEEEEMPESVWTPSKLIKRLGKEINHEESVLYWAHQNNIPIFCPALTDGSIGDMLYFHSYKRKGFVLDINADIRLLNDLAVKSHATGMIILGGGIVKHHTCNANLMRNGADWSVFVNTACDFDGSDAGATPDEAISWGKIKSTARPVKVCADASIVFPLIVSQTFAKDVEKWKEESEGCVCWLQDEE